MTDVVISKEPKVVNLVLHQGDDVSLPFRFGTEEDPIDLTGYTAKAQIRKKESPDSELLADFTCTIPDATDGIVIVVLASEDAALLPKLCYWDLELNNGSGFRRTYVKGKVDVGREVTV